MTNHGHLWSLCVLMSKKKFCSYTILILAFFGQNGRFDHLWTLSGHDRQSASNVTHDTSININHAEKWLNSRALH